MTEPNQLHGIWPAVLLPIDDDGRLRLDRIELALDEFQAGGVTGVYSGDTASEFYALEYDEWDRLATELRARAHDRGMPVGIGCTWTNQQGAVRRVRRARELQFDNVHLSQPYWLALNESARREFWTAVEAEARGMPVIVYAGSQGQFSLNASVMRQLTAWCPSIAGTKQTGFDVPATQSLVLGLPQLAHFVHEQVLVMWLALGAAGCMSNLAGLSSAKTVAWYGDIRAGRWQEALETQARVSRFYEEGAVPIRAGGYMVDKALAELGGRSGITRRMLPPYQAVPDDLFDGLRRAAQQHLPDWLAPDDMETGNAD